jgi:hypothetical protein
MQPRLHRCVRGVGEWVLLSRRLPREPSGPRTTLWRRLRRLRTEFRAIGRRDFFPPPEREDAARALAALTEAAATEQVAR